MNVESFERRIKQAALGAGIAWPQAAASLRDCLRIAHERVVKASDHPRIALSELPTFIQSRSVDCLWRIIKAPTSKCVVATAESRRSLRNQMEWAWKCRGISTQQGASLLAAFFQLLDEENVIDRGGRNSSVTVMTYWAIGDEAAYHLAGLFEGDEQGEAYTELCGYLDSRLRRFHKVVEMWEMEMDWDKEDAE